MDLPDLALKASSRRTFLALSAAGVLSLATRVHAHSNAGRVAPPQQAPATRLTGHDGKASSLQRLLKGHVTALQLVFTRCRATCPIQGALFASAQSSLTEVPGARLLSISIDPAADDPRVLSQWLARHEAGKLWRAACPEPRDLEPLMDFLKARSSGADRHTAQVYFFDREARLCQRSVDFPPASELVRTLAELAGKG